MRHTKMRAGLTAVTMLMLVAAACGDDVTPPRSDLSEPRPSTTTTLPATTPVETDASVATSTTTTAVVVTSPSTVVPQTTTQPPGPTPPTSADDLASPSLAVLDPRAGATVGVRMYVFRGTTDPGCTVEAAGQYQVEVDDSGNWEIALVLNPGGNVAVFEATDLRGATTELRVPVYHEPLVLRADGLGPVDFRDPMDDALATFVALLGAPDRDNVVTGDDLVAEYGDESPGLAMAVGYPAKEYARFVAWEDVGLQVMFSDYVAYEVEGAAPHFNGWIASKTGLVTSAGVGVGSSRTDLEAAYGAAFSWSPEPDDVTGSWHFNVDSGIPGWWPEETLHVYGRFTADPIDPKAAVRQIQAGFGFDEC